jgi:hypothetical protein
MKFSPFFAPLFLSLSLKTRRKSFNFSCFVLIWDLNERREGGGGGRKDLRRKIYCEVFLFFGIVMKYHCDNIQPPASLAYA